MVRNLMLATALFLYAGLSRAETLEVRVAAGGAQGINAYLYRTESGHEVRMSALSSGNIVPSESLYRLELGPVEEFDVPGKSVELWVEAGEKKESLLLAGPLCNRLYSIHFYFDDVPHNLVGIREFQSRSNRGLDAYRTFFQARRFYREVSHSKSIVVDLAAYWYFAAAYEIAASNWIIEFDTGAAAAAESIIGRMQSIPERGEDLNRKWGIRREQLRAMLDQASRLSFRRYGCVRTEAQNGNYQQALESAQYFKSVYETLPDKTKTKVGSDYGVNANRMQSDMDFLQNRTRTTAE